MNVKRSSDKREMILKRPLAGDRGGFIQIQAPRSFIFLAGVILVVLAIGIGLGAFWAGRHSAQARVAADAPRAAVLPTEKGTTTYEAKAGPWGELECQRTFLEVPEEYLGTRAIELDVPHWLFKGMSTNQVKELFDSAGLPPGAAAELLDSKRWTVGPGGVELVPSAGTIISLSTPARQKIYGVLARFPENTLLNQPFHWPDTEVDSWFAAAELSTETQALFKKLCYQRGNVMLFSDPAALLSTLPSQAEKNRFAKALMRRPVVFASLKVTPKTDIDALVNYWGVGGGAKDLRPLLEAAARVAGGRKVSISALLPPQVRGRLYTFPFESPSGHLNCHWTAFNFFKKNPDPATEDTAVWKRKLDSDYQPVSGAPRYGDLLVLAKPDGVIIHSCVYLADDLVYTKNGASPLAPWQVSTLSDLLTFYSWDLPEGGALRKGYFRLRE